MYINLDFYPLRFLLFKKGKKEKVQDCPHVVSCIVEHVDVQ